MADILDFGAAADQYYSLKALEAIVNNAWQNGLDKQALFETKIANATSSWLDDANAPTMTAATSTVPTVTEPGVNIPANADTDAFDLFDSKYADLVSTLAGYFSTFISTYFPDDNTTFAAVEAWLQDSIANPDQVLPDTLAALIWEGDRTRIQADAVRATDEVVAQWAAKGYPLPPGAAAAATTAIQLKAQEELAASSRNVAVKTFELAYEKMKFAITSAIEARKTALSAAGTYIAAIASAPDVASKMINVGYDAQSKLISSAAQFYNARTQAAELTFKANAFNADKTQEAAKANQASELTLIEDRLKALLTEAQALAQMATSLFNNIGARADISNSAQTTQAL